MKASIPRDIMIGLIRNTVKGKILIWKLGADPVVRKSPSQVTDGTSTARQKFDRSCGKLEQRVCGRKCINRYFSGR